MNLEITLGEKQQKQAGGFVHLPGEEPGLPPGLLSWTVVHQQKGVSRDFRIFKGSIDSGGGHVTISTCQNSWNCPPNESELY